MVLQCQEHCTDGSTVPRPLQCHTPSRSTPRCVTVPRPLRGLASPSVTVLRHFQAQPSIYGYIQASTLNLGCLGFICTPYEYSYMPHSLFTGLTTPLTVDFSAITGLTLN